MTSLEHVCYSEKEVGNYSLNLCFANSFNLLNVLNYLFKGEFLLKTNELSNIQIITVLAVIFLLMFIIYKTIYKTVTINQKRKIVPFQKNRKISPSRAARKSPKVKVTHNTSVFNFTNDSKDDYIQSCWDEVSLKKE